MKAYHSNMRSLIRPFWFFSVFTLGIALPVFPKSIAAEPSSVPTSDSLNQMKASPTEPELGDSISMVPKSLGKPALGLTKIHDFGSIAVLHDGRVKPLETMARDLVLRWSGRSQLPKKPALSVLADLIFTPEKTGELLLFRVDNPEVIEAMKIPAEKNRRYSYRKLEPGLHRLQALAGKADSVEKEKRSLVQNEILRLFSNLISYLNLTRTVQYALPSPNLSVELPATREALHLQSQEDATFWQLMEKAPYLAQILEATSAHTETERNPVELEVVRLSRAMYLQSQMGQSSFLQIFPKSSLVNQWSSPAEVIADPAELQKLHNEVEALASMTAAYRKGDGVEFNHQVAIFNNSVSSRAQAQLAHTQFPLERIYTLLDPLYLAIIGYWMALLCAFLFFLKRYSVIYQTAWFLALASISIHMTGIVMRIIIMQRPPVTSLYETFPFVSAVAIATALFLERRSRQGVALLSAAILGVILLSMANRYASDGDTMQMLVAVLNSNFWLSTHVICITVGYSACLLSGVIAHIRLLRTLTVPNPKTDVPIKETDRMVFGTLCFGLLFSFIGTVLGGIWADQSWGRFWGWDPKENGALLIVIWCAILLHARMFGTIREKGMAMGAVFGCIVVSVAWMGVNLLNVGLHSYGFTTGAAIKLFSFIGGEIFFLIIVAVGLQLKKKSPVPT